ncbi:MAG: hypothetical protein ACKPKO_46085, partial [Candidatus Fonsibacter sp.]
MDKIRSQILIDNNVKFSNISLPSAFKLATPHAQCPCIEYLKFPHLLGTMSGAPTWTSVPDAKRGREAASVAGSAQPPPMKKPPQMPPDCASRDRTATPTPRQETAKSWPAPPPRVAPWGQVSGTASAGTPKP